MENIAMKYSMLSSQYKLRGWTDDPYTLVHDGEMMKLSKDEFDTLLLCDGITDIEKLQDQKTIDTLLLFRKKGIVCFSQIPEEIDREQRYFLYDNPYICDVSWTITGRCNFRCRHCELNTPDAAMNEMTHEEAVRVIDRMAECGAQRLHLAGGEPFVREDFWSLVDYALEKGIKIEKIHTNGWMLTESVLDKFERRGIKPEFCVSFDGVDRHDWIRGIKGAEQAALNALKRCYIRGFRTSVEMNLHRGNVDVLRETVDVLADAGVGKILCREIKDNDMWKRYAAGNEMTAEEYLEAVLRYIPAYYADGMRIDIRFDGIVEMYKGSGEYSVIDGNDEGGGCAERHIGRDGEIVLQKRTVYNTEKMWNEKELQKVRNACAEAKKRFTTHSA